MTLARRRFLASALGASAALVIVRPAGATPEEMQAAIDEFTGGAPVTEGRVTVDIPRLVENGNAVPMTVSVESPMTEDDHVTDIAVFNEMNPLPDVVRFQLTPRSGRASVSTRIRLSATQSIHAVARLSDGSLWSGRIHVIVTAPACRET